MFSSTASRLASCPVCGKNVHIALVAAHVDHCLTTTTAAAAATTTAMATTRPAHAQDVDARARANATVDEAGENTNRGPGGAAASMQRGALYRERERKRQRDVLVDRSNTASSTMNAFVKNGGERPGALSVERSSPPTMVHAETQTDFAQPANDGSSGGDGADAGAADEVDVDKAVEDVEGGAPSRIAFDLRVMSGNHEECGICLTAFDDDEGVHRYMFYPCQHVRQCGDCAQRVWQVPKAKRRCPWCKSKIEIRPRAFKPFM